MNQRYFSILCLLGIVSLEPHSTRGYFFIWAQNLKSQIRTCDGRVGNVNASLLLSNPSLVLCNPSAPVLFDSLEVMTTELAIILKILLLLFWWPKQIDIIFRTIGVGDLQYRFHCATHNGCSQWASSRKYQCIHSKLILAQERTFLALEPLS